VTENELSKVFHLAFALVRSPHECARLIALVRRSAPLTPPSAALRDGLDALSQELPARASKRMTRADLERGARVLFDSASEGPKAIGRSLLHALGAGDP
jgi:hypothetical protein